MGSRILDALQTQGTHSVGNLNSLKIKTVANGAIVEGAPIDNFSLGELGFNAEGERTVKQLSAKDKKAVLVASPETRYLGESMADFYNAVGERVRCVLLEAGYTRFESSAFSLNTGVTEIKNGQVAHFDPATKKFIISTASAAHADFATSSAQFLVVSNEEDIRYTLGQPTVRFEVIKA